MDRYGIDGSYEAGVWGIKLFQSDKTSSTYLGFSAGVGIARQYLHEGSGCTNIFTCSYIIPYQNERSIAHHPNSDPNSKSENSS